MVGKSKIANINPVMNFLLHQQSIADNNDFGVSNANQMLGIIVEKLGRSMNHLRDKIFGQLNQITGIDVDMVSDTDIVQGGSLISKEDEDDITTKLETSFKDNKAPSKEDAERFQMLLNIKRGLAPDGKSDKPRKIEEVTHSLKLQWVAET